VGQSSLGRMGSGPEDNGSRSTNETFAEKDRQLEFQATLQRNDMKNMKGRDPKPGDPIPIGKLSDSVFLTSEPKDDLFWLFQAVHLLHAEAYQKKDKKALKLIKTFCKSVDAAYLSK
jgi:hypothetical protein